MMCRPLACFSSNLNRTSRLWFQHAVSPFRIDRSRAIVVRSKYNDCVTDFFLPLKILCPGEPSSMTWWLTISRCRFGRGISIRNSTTKTGRERFAMALCFLASAFAKTADRYERKCEFNAEMLTGMVTIGYLRIDSNCLWHKLPHRQPSACRTLPFSE